MIISMENAIPPDELALMKRWVDTWKTAGPELERIKREELRAMTEQEALLRVERVMNSRAPDRWNRPDRRTSSGLIEQQRLFAGLRERRP